MLSMYDSREYVVEAMRAGASGYLVKSAAVDELVHALAALSGGKTYLSPSVSVHLIHALTAPVAFEKSLTPRQNEILALVAKGQSSKEIARSLDLSIRTIETHRAQIMDRLNIRDLAGLVRYAVHTGVVKAEG